MNDARPTLRILHHLARTGGTLVSRCLASMRGVTLLSEMHPRGSEVALQFDPLYQAQYWFKLLSGREVDALRAASAPFAARIDALHARAAERDECLVLRDWNHADFMARPVFDAPTGRFALVEALEERFRLVRVATVRHPLPQWLSWRRYAPESGIGEADFWEGCRRFAEAAAEIGFVRYEDFLDNAVAGTRRLAEALELEFDDQFAYRWIFHRSLSGDLGNLESREIRPPRPVEIDPEEAGRIEANADYRRTLELLGYEPFGEGPRDAKPEEPPAA